MLIGNYVFIDIELFIGNTTSKLFIITFLLLHFYFMCYYLSLKRAYFPRGSEGT